jgi:SAM-dependent methyltransferase
VETNTTATPFATSCIVCGNVGITSLLPSHTVPVHCNLLWSSREGARTAPRGEIALAFCPRCGHVFNGKFDPRLMEYTQAYENSLHYSPRFQRYAEELADLLIARFDLHGKEIIDIGCGRGDFLALLVGRGGNHGMGFDPSDVPDYADPGPRGKMEVIRDFYSPRYAQTAADFVICRQVLEHIPEPRGFIRSIRTALGPRFSVPVFFEVPNVLYTLRDKGIWDLIYEHCSYFSAPSLEQVFRLSDFEVHGVTELYEAQFIGLESRPHDGPVGGEAQFAHMGGMLSSLAREFSATYASKVRYWRETLESLQQRGKKVVVWGSGSKGVTFLNILGNPEVITHVVDVNPRKQGMFVAGTGHEIVSPDHLTTTRPDTIIVMNAIYTTEIRQQMEALGVRADILTA